MSSRYMLDLFTELPIPVYCKVWNVREKCTRETPNILKYILKAEIVEIVEEAGSPYKRENYIN